MTALLAGNAVIVKPSPQAPLSAERFCLVGSHPVPMCYVYT